MASRERVYNEIASYIFRVCRSYVRVAVYSESNVHTYTLPQDATGKEDGLYSRVFEHCRDFDRIRERLYMRPSEMYPCTSVSIGGI